MSTPLNNNRKLMLLVLGVTGLLALRTSYLAFLFVDQTGQIERRHIESASFILAAAMLACGLVAVRNGVILSTPHVGKRHVLSVSVVCAVGVLLFAPTLTIGLLSDDFTLLDHATHWRLLPSSWEHMRPVPLAVWAVLGNTLRLDVASALHAFNVTLHVLNAVLVYFIGLKMALGARAALLAACLFVVFPSNVEPVAWASGVFDVAMTTAILLIVVSMLAVWLRSRWRLLAVVFLTVVALLTKETAVAIPCILAAILLITGDWNRRASYGPVLAAVGCVAPYVFLRLFWKGGSVALPSNGYQVKELMSRPLGTLAAPFQSAVSDTSPVFAAAAAVIPVLLFVLATRWGTRDDIPRVAMGLIVWVYAAVAPLGTLFYIGPDLQGSRYLYLPSVAWSLGLGGLARPSSGRPIHHLATLILTLLTCVYFAASTTLIEHWRVAALLRDGFLNEVQQAVSRCAPATIPIPDNHRGAFVLRNGAAEALRARGLTAPADGVVIRLPGC